MPKKIKHKIKKIEEKNKLLRKKTIDVKKKDKIAQRKIEKEVKRIKSAKLQLIFDQKAIELKIKNRRLKVSKKKLLAFVISAGLLFFVIWAYSSIKVQSTNQKNGSTNISSISVETAQAQTVDAAKEELLKKYLVEDFNLKIKDTDFEKLVFEKNVPMLMYHYIEPENATQSVLRRNLSVTPENFESQVKWLYDNGFKAITLSNYFSLIADNKEIPAKTVLITIDDGYIDFFENGAPILNRYNMTATVFLITDSVGLPAYMNWDQIKLLSEQGFEFDSHTLTHPDLRKLTDDKLKKELVDSKKKIEEETGKNVDFLCYPMGFFDARVEMAARSAGYRGGITTINGSRVSNKNMFELPRFRVTHTMVGENFAWMLNKAQ